MARALRCLGLDIATFTGWAISDGAIITQSGVRDFRKSTWEHPGMRGIKFYNFLLSLGQFDEIFYEKPQFTGKFNSSDGGELQKGLLMVLNMYAAGFDAKTYGIHPSTLKLQFGGHGRASKEEMCAAAHALGWKGGQVGTALGHDEADGIAVLKIMLRDRHGITARF